MKCQMLCRVIGEFLTDDTGAIASEIGCNGFLCLGIRAFHIFQVIVLVTVGTIVCEGGIGADMPFIDI